MLFPRNPTFLAMSLAMSKKFASRFYQRTCDEFGLVHPGCDARRKGEGFFQRLMPKEQCGRPNAQGDRIAREGEDYPTVTNRTRFAAADA